MARVNPGQLRDALLNMLEGAGERAGIEGAQSYESPTADRLANRYAPNIERRDGITPTAGPRLSEVPSPGDMDSSLADDFGPGMDAMDEGMAPGLMRRSTLRDLLRQGMDGPIELRSKMDPMPGSRRASEADELMGPKQRERFDAIKQKIASGLANRGAPDQIVTETLRAKDPKGLSQLLASIGVDDQMAEDLLR